MAGRDSSIRGAVAFGPAAASWQRSAEFRDALLAAVRNTSAAIMLIHTANDYDTTPGISLAAELERLHKPRMLKIYPPVGLTPSEGHKFLYTDIPYGNPTYLRSSTPAPSTDLHAGMV